RPGTDRPDGDDVWGGSLGGGRPTCRASPVQGRPVHQVDLDPAAVLQGPHAGLADRGRRVTVPDAGAGDLAAPGGVDPGPDLVVVRLGEAFAPVLGDGAAPAAGHVGHQGVAVADAGGAAFADHLGLHLVAEAAVDEDLHVGEGAAVGLQHHELRVAQSLR